MQIDIFGLLIGKLPLGICILDKDFTILYWNDFFASRVPLQPNAVGSNFLQIFPDESRFLKKKLNSVLVLNNSSFSYWEHRPHIFKFNSSRPITGEETMMFQNLEIVPLQVLNGEVQTLCLIVQDVTEQASYFQAQKQLADALEIEHAAQLKLINKLETAQGQLLQAEKMASIGQLAAGVAHEINNPIGFINSNLQSLRDYSSRLIKLVDFGVKLIEKEANPIHLQLKADFYKRQQYAFIKEDIQELIAESLDGAERVTAIVQNLKSFSHVDNSEWQLSDIRDGMKSTMKIVANELKYKADVHINFATELLPLLCQPMQLNQVFMNLLVNSAQAIETKGDIWVSIEQLDSAQIVKVRDTGSGISKANLKKIFEPFFTTKDVGKGTGLGLSLSYSIIKKHQGHISAESEPGSGTTFTLTLPMRSPEQVQQHEQQLQLHMQSSGL